jgi:hypothetical protein
MGTVLGFFPGMVYSKKDKKYFHEENENFIQYFGQRLR